MRKFSPSSTNQFFKCPYQWKLLRIDKVQTEPKVNHKAELGGNIHDIIKEYYQNIVEKPSEKQIEHIAMSCFNMGFDETLKQYRANAETMMKNFINFEKGRIRHYIKPIMVEQTLENDLFRGIIDYFDGKNIIDWKTGAMMRLGNDERRQGKIYNILLNDNGYKGDFKVYFVTLANGRKLELPLTTRTWLEQEIKKMVGMIKAERFPKNKSPLCNWCDARMACEFDGTFLWENIGVPQI